MPLTARARGEKIVLRNVALDRVPYLGGLIGEPSGTANALTRILARCCAIVILHKRSMLTGSKTVVRCIGCQTASDYNAVYYFSIEIKICQEVFGLFFIFHKNFSKSAHQKTNAHEIFP